MNASLPTGLPGRLLALGLTLLVIGALWIGAVGPLTGWYAERSEGLAQQRALARRMTELAATLPDLRKRASSAARTGPATATLLQGESDAVAGATLQEAVQRMATGAGATLSSVEMLPTAQEGAYRPIRLRVSLSAPWPVVIHLLAALEEATPLMLLDDLQVTGVRLLIQPVAMPLEATFTVVAFRAGGQTAAAQPGAQAGGGQSGAQAGTGAQMVGTQPGAGP